MYLRVLLFLSLLSVSAQTFDDLARRASQARDSGDLAQAIALYRQALELSPAWSEGWWYLGTASYDADRYDVAREALARCVALKPEVSPAWGLLGLSEFQLNDYEHALPHIERSLADARLDPQMIRVLRFHEGLLLARAGEFDRALESYAIFARDDHPPAELLTALGITALRQPLMPADVPSEQRALFDAAGETVWTAMSEDETRGARAFAQLLSRFPNSPEVRVLVEGYLLTAPLRDAGDEYRHELDLNASDAAAAAMLASLLLDHQDAASARSWAARAVQLAPGLSLAQCALGRALVETGDTSTGIRHLETAAQLDPANIETGIALASAYSKAGRTTDAQAERDHTLKLALQPGVHAPG